jgi:hypothetical protein
VPPANAMPAPFEKIAQHTRAGERVLEVQFIDLTHERGV